MRYLALGDSYTIGEGVPEAQRWPVQLAGRLSKRGMKFEAPQIIARTGWTTADLQQALARESPRGPFDLVTLLIGVNNQYQGRELISYAHELDSLLATSIQLAGGDARRVVILSIPDWGVTPFAEGRDRAQISREIDWFNVTLREHATAVGARFVDVTPISRAPEYATWLVADGLHPSGRMYGAWVELAMPEVFAALGMPETRTPGPESPGARP